MIQSAAVKNKPAIKFGAVAPKLKDQLADAGVKACEADIKQWQADADAITRLAVRGLLSRSAVVSLRIRLMKLIWKGIAE